MRDMHARARELTRNPEHGVTLPGSGGPTYRNIGGAVSSPYSDVVAPTAGHEDNLEEAGTLNKIMDPSPLKGVQEGGRYNNNNNNNNNNNV